jgi:hypothetical protein
MEYIFESEHENQQKKVRKTSTWCSASQAALPPPAAFALPAPTIASLPVNGPPDACEQRTATWAWAEPEWRVVVWRDGDSSADTVEGAENTMEETDADGWVYCDNKWESHSGKGGLGKVRDRLLFLFSFPRCSFPHRSHRSPTLLQCTRYRHWTRTAILTESTKRVGPGPTGVLCEGGQLQPLDTLAGGGTRGKTSEKEKERVETSPRHRAASLERHTPIVLGASCSWKGGLVRVVMLGQVRCCESLVLFAQGVVAATWSKPRASAS